jgi:predicted metal-dependent phosphoesterase TrpH
MPHAPWFDLQSHSDRSDGALAPAEVVARAARAGVRLLALTDHDTVEGVPEAVAAARRHGIALSPAAEISSVHETYEDLHVLGYGLDHTDGALGATLEDWRADRGRRIGQMADRLEALGLALDRTGLERRRAQGRPLGRPHLAQAVLAHPGNRARLAAEGIAGPDELFPAYLVPGAPAYVGRQRPTVAQAIEVIHAAGGVAVWAHPFWDVEDPAEVIGAIDAFDGLDGVECFYITHTREQTRLLYDACIARGLATTGSADFHGPEHDRFHAFRAFETYGLEPDLRRIRTS